ncbi:MAG: AAA family ATPase [bacterium]|nr:AAA family ATPase [bacterium]
MKIAVSGKGGVGKTTLVSLLAFTFASKGNKVLALDADPDSNLGLSLGLSLKETKEIVPLSEMKELIAERTGTKPGIHSPFFRMNPKVDDIPEKYSKSISDGIKLLVLGGLKTGGGGCFCPENALLKTLLKHLLVNMQEIVLIDMEAGIEHLSRGTSESVDALIIVIDSGKKSLQTAYTIERLAKELAIKNVFVVINRIRTDDDINKIQNEIKLPVLGFISFDQDILKQDQTGNYHFDKNSKITKEIKVIIDNLEKKLKENKNV